MLKEAERSPVVPGRDSDPGAPPLAQPAAAAGAEGGRTPPREIGGPSGPEPTRYGDWERKGRCIDF